MKRGSPIRFWAAGLLLCSALSGPAMLRASAQTGQAQTVELLEQARLLEGRGRMDLAKQKWQQVLLVDPGNVEGLAGLARVAKLEGRDDDAKAYLDRIRGANPFAPKIARNDRQAATKRFPMAKARRTAPKSKPPTADEIATQQAMRARSPEVQAAYNLLNSHHVHQAEAAFKAAIAKNPSDAQALAGMGQVRMEQANFGGAISFLEQAEQEGAAGRAVLLHDAGRKCGAAYERSGDGAVRVSFGATDASVERGGDAGDGGYSAEGSTCFGGDCGVRLVCEDAAGGCGGVARVADVLLWRGAVYGRAGAGWASAAGGAWGGNARPGLPADAGVGVLGLGARIASP